MLYTREIAFIHVPKTAGMSITHFLVNALDDPVTVFAPEGAREHTFRMAENEEARRKLSFRVGRRHETCLEAIAAFRRHNLPRPPQGFAVIRDPVDLMLSYYRHMRKPEVWRLRGMTPTTLRGAPRAAISSTFDEFCRAWEFYGLNDREMLAYFDAVSFQNFDIVPVEALSKYLQYRFNEHGRFDISKLGHRNRSGDDVARLSAIHVSQKTASFIRHRYACLTEIYEEALDIWL